MKSLFTIVSSEAQSNAIGQRLRHHHEDEDLTLEFLTRQDGIQRLVSVAVSSLEEYSANGDEPRRILMHGTLVEKQEHLGKKVIVLYTPMEYIGDGSGSIILTEPNT